MNKKLKKKLILFNKKMKNINLIKFWKKLQSLTENSEQSLVKQINHKILKKNKIFLTKTNVNNLKICQFMIKKTAKTQIKKCLKIFQENQYIVL